MDTAITANKKCVWNKRIEDTELEKFKSFVSAKHEIKFETYWDLHRWSIKNYKNFWEDILIFFNVIFHGSYDEVAKKKGSHPLIDIEWFSGAKINFVENLLRYKDDGTALVVFDEEGYQEIITYAQLYDEVKMYAAAFAHLGLQAGDIVAHYIPCRKEVVFAMLAVLSLGGVWTGVLPFLSAQGAAYIIRPIKPKILITTDTDKTAENDRNMLLNIPTISNGLDSLVKIIVVPSRKDLSTIDISGIEKSCFLQNFLECGQTSGGTYPDISFAHLPFNHPIFIHFTSGTTGPPKGVIHSAASVLHLLTSSGLHSNITRKDIILASSEFGRAIWSRIICNLALGSQIFLYVGKKTVLLQHYWNILSKYKITYNIMAVQLVTHLAKSGHLPDFTCDLQNLKLIITAGCAVLPKILDFLHDCVDRCNMFLGFMYGCTELMDMSGFDFNSPVYNGEIQLPCLGVDLRCYGEKGNEVLGQRGEAIIGTPAPSIPIGILNDLNNTTLTNNYLSKYEGVWSQHDECWVNPTTKGIVVTGRSDDILNVDSCRFGPSDIYFAVQTMEELDDYICVGQSSQKTLNTRCILFVKIKPGFTFSEELVKKINSCIANEFLPNYIPEIILETEMVPYNFSGKKMESIVRKIISTNKIPKFSSIRNPECLTNYLNIPELQNY